MIQKPKITQAARASLDEKGCGCIAANAKKHTMTDTSTTMAELVEAFNASQSLVGVRNLHTEMGITLNARG